MSKARNITKFKKENLFDVWVNFKNTGTITIRRSLGVSSITDSGTGNFVLNFVSGYLQDSNYVVVTQGRDGDNDNTTVTNTGFRANDTKTASQLRVRITYKGVSYDSPETNIFIVGAQ
jgi:hypothetical protein